MLKRHSQFFKGLMVVNDLFFISLAWWLAYFARFHTGLFPSPEPYLFQDYLIAWLLILIIWPSVFLLLDLYRPRRLSTHWHEAVEVLKGSCLALLVFLGIIFLLREIILSRIGVVLFFALAFGLLNLSRVTVREGLRFLRRKGYNLRHVAVIGTPLQANRLVQKLEWHRHLGLHVAAVSWISDSASSEGDRTGEMTLTDQEDALSLVKAGDIDQVFITLPLDEASRLKAIRDWLGDEPVTTYFVPDLGDLSLLGGSVEAFDGLQIIGLQDSPLYGWHALLKRGLDLVAGGTALVVVSPLMALIALGIKLTSPGPVCYRQERMGLDGKRFQMLKFRTMIEDAEKLTGPTWAIENDPRVTALGRWLRRFSLDELPQLFNVLRGEMSLVGPRPERPPLIDEFRKSIPKYMLRHKVKAGMTGWAQIHGWRGNTSLEARIRHDLDYIENWSLSRDIKILARTVFGGFINKKPSDA
jgi:Undecaprenyl-phosphate glucose phosphotransferase